VGLPEQRLGAGAREANRRLSYEGPQLSEAVSFTPVAVVRLLSERGGSSMTTVDPGGRFVLSSVHYTASVEGVIRMPIEE
jgi:hypothetical protein